jgi:salicylate hydroxylase
VIGADGIHSSVRSQFAFDNPQYSGKIVYRGLVPIDELQSWWPLDTYAASWLGQNKHLLVFPISQNRLLNVVAFVTIEESELGDLKESWTTVGDREEVLKSFEEFEPTARRIIELMPKEPSKWVVNDREPLQQWIYLDGKVVLLGDAAHAMSPHQGRKQDIAIWNFVYRSN